MPLGYAQLGGGFGVSTGGASAATTAGYTLPSALQPTYLGIAAVVSKSTTATIQSIAQPDSPNLAWRSLGRVVGTTLTLELIALWGFGTGASAALTITFSASIFSVFPVAFFDTGTAQSAAVTAGTMVSAVGTGTAVDPGSSVTAAIGDLAFTAAAWPSANAPSATADTVPSAGDTFTGVLNGTQIFGAIAGSLAWKVVRAPGAHRRVSTIGSSLAWVAAAVTVTPVPPSATPVTATGLFKGRTTKTADLGAVA